MDGSAWASPLTADGMTREDVLSRYRHLRRISIDHHTRATELIGRSAILNYGKRLRVVSKNSLLLDHEEELTLVIDAAMYGRPTGRSRAIDRYAKASTLPAHSDEALMLDAMRQATFSIWHVQRRHDRVGLVVQDVLRRVDAWLIDEGLEQNASDDLMFAARLSLIDGFAMTNGVVVPVTPEMIEDVLEAALDWDVPDPPPLADDPRFLMAVYRVALEHGIMGEVQYV